MGTLDGHRGAADRAEDGGARALWHRDVSRWWRRVEVLEEGLQGEPPVRFLLYGHLVGGREDPPEEWVRRSKDGRDWWCERLATGPRD